MSSTILLPHAHSFVIGPAVINTHILKSTTEVTWAGRESKSPSQRRKGYSKQTQGEE
jgi:hypothetical protein